MLCVAATPTELTALVTDLATNSLLFRRVLDLVAAVFSSAPPSLLVAKRGNTEAVIKRIQLGFVTSPIESLMVIHSSKFCSGVLMQGI